MADAEMQNSKAALHNDGEMTKTFAKPSIPLLGLSVVIGAGSLGVLIGGFFQAYTFNPALSTPGAPPVAGMSGVVGLTLFFEVYTTMKFTSNKYLADTFAYRMFIYLSMVLFGFLSMVFYAAPLNQVEALASFGSVLWMMQACLGAAHLYRFRQSVEQEDELVTKKKLENCCGVACCSKRGCCTRFGCKTQTGMCCRWTMWAFVLLFFVQAACILNDNILYLQGGAGTKGTPLTLVPVTTASGSKINMAWYCTGTQASGDPAILLEAGGGSGMVSMIPVLNVLTKEKGVRACAYDRAGYGFSQSGDPFSSLDATTSLTFQSLQFLGERGPFICAGHSAGGSVCRNFKRLYPSNVTGIALLDAYCNDGPCNIEVQWDIAQGKSAGNYQAIYGFRLALVDALRWFTPFALVRMFLSQPGFAGANHGGNLAWNTQYTEFRPSPIAATDAITYEAMWWGVGNLGATPLVIATGGVMDDCEMRNIQPGSQDCLNYLTQQNATLVQVSKYLTTSSLSKHLDCLKCNHGYVQEKPRVTADYIMLAFQASKTGVFPA